MNFAFSEEQEGFRELLRRFVQERWPAAESRRLAGTERGYEPDYGARPLARLIQKELKNPLTDEVLFGRLKGGGRVRVDVDAEGAFVFDFDA